MKMAANQFSYLNMKKGKNLKRSGRKDQLLASSSLGNGQAAASTADSLVSAPGTSHSLQNAAADSTNEDIQLSTCLVCGKKDRSIEFILPDRYCSQSCADQHGSSEFGDAVPATKSKPTSKSVNGQTTSHRAPGKRKKKRASYLSAYEENFTMDCFDGRRGKKPLLHMNQKSEVFVYEKFLSEEGLRAAPEHLFIREPEPSFSNLFTVGMKLEAIDPLHPTAFCVTTVKEVRGHRIRLHFDGYLECYDFWTNAYSDQIFPCGWCEENGKTLQPPKGVHQESFTWQKYFQLTRSKPIPKKLFVVCTNEFKAKSPQFQVGDKLEAVDVKNQSLVCVATVSDVYGDRILVHFDGWEDAYDYWCYYNSLYIHPVGWCQENARILSAPNGYPNPDTFTWDSYTQETNSRPAPREAFQTPLLLDFHAGMVLEAIDKRNPILVRVAEVLEVKENRLLIHFCGWDNKYDYWEDADCPDLHPIGWCSKTGHPLQQPLTPLHIANYSGNCPTSGCYGYGHVKGAQYSSHQSLVGCPYSDTNMSKDIIVPERLASSFLGIYVTSQDANPPAVASDTSRCSTAGCDGSGHVTGRYPTHSSVSGCPLAISNQDKLMRYLDVNKQQILAKTNFMRTVGVSRVQSGSKPVNQRVSKIAPKVNNPTETTVTSVDPGTSTPRPVASVSSPQTLTCDTIQTSQSDTSHSSGRQSSTPSVPLETPPIVTPPTRLSSSATKSIATNTVQADSAADGNMKIQDAVYDSVFPSPSKVRKEGLPNMNLLEYLVPAVSDINPKEVPQWSSEQVTQFVAQTVQRLNSSQLEIFAEEDIDGMAFLMLQRADIIHMLKLKLGAALKIHTSVQVLRHKLGMD